MAFRSSRRSRPLVRAGRHRMAIRARLTFRNSWSRSGAWNARSESTHFRLPPDFRTTRFPGPAAERLSDCSGSAVSRLALLPRLSQTQRVPTRAAGRIRCLATAAGVSWRRCHSSRCASTATSKTSLAGVGPHVRRSRVRQASSTCTPPAERRWRPEGQMRLREGANLAGITTATRYGHSCRATSRRTTNYLCRGGMP